jgi:hypothetical protein
MRTRNRAGAKGVEKHLNSDKIETNIKFIFSTAFPFLLHLQIFVQEKSLDIRKTFRETETGKNVEWQRKKREE